MATFDKDGRISGNSDLIKSNRIDPAPLVDITAKVSKMPPSRDGLLARMFPSKEQRAMAEGRLRMIETECEFMQKALVLSRETQIASLKETCEHYLIRQKVEVRQQIATHILSELQKLQDNLDRISDEFMRSMEHKIKQAESIENELIKNVRHGQLKSDLIEFANLQQSLVERFRHSFPVDSL
jgi:hypothetical protein